MVEADVAAAGSELQALLREVRLDPGVVGFRLTEKGQALAEVTARAGAEREAALERAEAAEACCRELEARVEGLQSALEPFARYAEARFADRVQADNRGDRPSSAAKSGPEITLADCLRARAVLSSAPDPGRSPPLGANP